MKKISVIFPGQGAQYVGMGEGFLYSGKAQDIFNKVNDVLDLDIKNLCLKGPQDVLARTENSQVALYTLGYIGFLLLKQAMPSIWTPAYCAGLSLGEFTALAVAGVYSFEDGLKLVYNRGKYMQQACEDNPGTMASIIGADRNVVKNIVSQYNKLGSLVALANLNCPGQIVVSGTKEAVEQVVSKAQDDGYRAVLLNVSGAFHSSLMESARVKLAQAVSEIKFNDAVIPVISNCDAVIRTDADEIKSAVIKQMVSPVLWEDSINELIKNGVGQFVECGCAKVLKGLLRRINRKAVCMVLENQADIDKVVASFCGQPVQ
ncbi:ACP S-malonyltransferase [bacterium]|nr:ACP S-malonyltransferase [bacterium]